MKIDHLPYVHAGYVNTPLEPMPGLAGALGFAGGLYIKRDDLTGLALGGNKSRKLNYIVKYALDHGYTALMTFGGVQTNHGRLTAAAALRYGLKPILVLKGAKPDYLSGNLLLDRMMGADIYFIDTDQADALPPEKRETARKQYLEDCAANIIRHYESQGHKVLSIPVGGQTVIGSAGYVQAVPEIMKQMESLNIHAKYLVTGYGSTGTFAGLWAGARYYHAPFEVIGIPVEPDYRPVEETAAFINEISDYFEMGFSCEGNDLRLETGDASNPYSGTGYNEPDQTTQKYMALLAQTEGIFTDPCYTGKVFHGYVDLLKKGIISAEDGAIFMHTGGAPGIWSKEHLDHMQKQFWSDEETDHVRVMKMN